MEVRGFVPPNMPVLVKLIACSTGYYLSIYLTLIPANAETLR